ncbi:MAG: deoxyguanosinetriphosphate triphosphohydrolase [Acutalibacteraceae bacterium]
MAPDFREYTEKTELETLSPKAAFSSKTLGRDVYEEPDALRTEFQRDRDRIIHCKAFRRLKLKTQVFLAPEGDHYRTRLTHTLEVAQIARTIARALKLNEDLTEAIALAHDLGHTPFGHAGERALDAVVEGGFAHYKQGVRVVERLEKDGKGLNLTKEVRNGILCHTKGEEAFTLEGRVVRIADRIAYINHDIDDAERAGVLSEEDIPSSLRKMFGTRLSERVNTMVLSVVKNSGDGIKMDKLTAEAFDELHAFLFKSVYTNPVAKGEEGKAIRLVQQLFMYFRDNPEALPDDVGFVLNEEGAERAACDYIAGMTDHFAVKVYKETYIPLSWNVLD